MHRISFFFQQFNGRLQLCPAHSHLVFGANTNINVSALVNGILKHIGCSSCNLAPLIQCRIQKAPDGRFIDPELFTNLHIGISLCFQFKCPCHIVLSDLTVGERNSASEHSSRHAHAAGDLNVAHAFAPEFIHRT